MSDTSDDALNLLSDLIAKAKAAGADQADAIIAKGRSQSATQRMGNPEAIERSEENDLGLRVLVGQRQAMVSSSDLSSVALDELVDRAVAMAKVAPEDPFVGLAEPGQLCDKPVEIDMFDAAEPTAEELQAQAAAAEEAALAVSGVTNSDSADAGWSVTDIAMAASNGFSGSYRRTSSYVSAVMIAGSGDNMERDYDYTATVHRSDLEDPAAVGKRAGERVVRRLDARQTATKSVPVIFDPRVSRSIISHLASAINGSSIARGTSFLKDKMGEQIFADSITIVDEPHRDRGFRSKPFDAEGLTAERRNIIDKGVLTSWFLDLGTARQLDLTSTGHASRGVSGPPSPSASNLYIEPGDVSAEDLIGDIKDGFYVTEMMGSSVSIVTGDYSRGAGGFWIENGELTDPIAEATVAGKLQDIFMNITAADDLTFRYGVDAPTLRIDGLVVAGSG